MTTNEIKMQPAASNHTADSGKMAVMQVYPRACCLQHTMCIKNADGAISGVTVNFRIYDCADLPIQSRILIGQGVDRDEAWLNAAQYVTGNQIH